MSFVIQPGLITPPLTAGGVAYGTGSAALVSAAGTATQLLQSNGASAPSWINISGATVGTATNLAGGSNGTIPYQSAAGTTQMLAVGTAGQLLQTNGAGAPSWITPSAGAMTLISTSTFSAASLVDFTGVTGYSNYRIIIRNLTLATNSTLELRFGRPTISTTGYQYSQIYLDSAAIQRSYNNTSATRIYLISSDISTNADNGVAGSIDIFNFGVGGVPKIYSNLGFYFNTTPAWTFMQTYGLLYDTTPASVIRFFSSGSTISGTISLYGISI